eukprot:4694854-Lingulodinium_polyedra.AAC.1
MKNYLKEKYKKQKRKHYSAQHWRCHVNAKSGTGSGPVGQTVRFGILYYEDFPQQRASWRRAGHRYAFLRQGQCVSGGPDRGHLQ